ncbi:MAG TPA: hypothetical protein VMU45_13840 [Candidatus Eisenbacteria bacterium]|nr:hypothetical protein [Candidatus Eisenbacteria bacterium]
MLGSFAAAQVTVQPRVEIFGGYSWLHPNGYVDWGKVPDIPHGWNASSTFYFPNVRNLGVVVDGSGHYNSTYSNVGLGLLGLQYKFRNDQFSPFVRVLAGASHISPAGLNAEWRAAVGGGGGFDLTLTNLISLRIAQADYIYTSYSPQAFTGHNSTWNMVRLSAGVVLNVGNYYTAPLSAACTANPTAPVYAGDPVTVTATGTNFSPKHTLTYAWTATGGKLASPSTATSSIDTTGLAAGSYTANATITDPKYKKNNSASCSTSFTVKPFLPPDVTCTTNPSTVKTGETSTILTSATSPDGATITDYAYSASAGTIQGAGTSAKLNTAGLPGSTVTVTVTATDSHGMKGTGTCTVGVVEEIKCVNIEDWGECTFEKDPKRPWRVDNDCKDVLDKLALRLQQNPNGKLQVVGYTDEKEVVKEATIGAQRSVNVKFYMTQDELGPKADASRIEPRQGGTKGKATHFYFVPEGGLCQGQVVEGTPVDENVVKGQARKAAPPHHKKAKKAAAPPAQ